MDNIFWLERMEEGLQKNKNAISDLVLADKVHFGIKEAMRNADAPNYESYKTGLGRFGKQTYKRTVAIEENTAKTQLPITTFEQSMKRVFELALSKKINSTLTSALILLLGIYDYIHSDLTRKKVKARATETWVIIGKKTGYEGGCLRLFYGALKGYLNNINNKKTGYRNITISPQNIPEAHKLIKEYHLIKFTPETSK